MPSAEELAASLESGETMDDQFLAGHGGKLNIFTEEYLCVVLFHNEVVDFVQWSPFIFDHKA